jgi:hypothetical protein
MLVGRVGLPMSLRTYRLIEAALGLACAAAVLMGRRRGWSMRTTVAACLSLSLCWMTLAGPATESSTYVLLAPILGLAALTVADRPRWQRCVVGDSFVLFPVAAMIVWFPGWIAHPVQSTGIQPFAALLLTVHVVVECWREVRAGAAGRTSGTELPRAA